ncbi:hypothetical protein J1C67_14880 [Clostridium gasigenes]|uniref:hypothetical protein n=1 Tax=Clostridium gasigenes TaxID=94869 RepID=UPI001438683F|nr:hypothetical protein [Clostridium gasigenes]NKF05369.1 hypothetical protein [Clostridium gasigenes]QSW18819.1 hypothetical protein J1C67_14880 [Clostridium gasigenes]
MFNIDLMNIFQGLVRNYLKFNLTTESNKFEILKKELDYIVEVGEVLGYSSILTGINEESRAITDIIEIRWHNYDDKNTISNELFLYFSKELDLIEDVKAINNLVNTIDTKSETKFFVQIIEVSSKDRVDYLNKLLQYAKRFNSIDVLIIYKTSNIREQTSEYYSYLFKESKLVKQKNACSYYDVFGSLKMKFH